MLIYRAIMMGWLALVAVAPTLAAAKVDLSGEWEITEEERSYIATRDAGGSGTYTWQNGRITSTSFVDGRWQGSWQQTGNDRADRHDLGPEAEQGAFDHRVLESRMREMSAELDALPLNGLFEIDDHDDASLDGRAEQRDEADPDGDGEVVAKQP